MTHLPQANDIYRHFKGNLYRVVALAKHTETGETLVIYQALYGEYQIYARPLSMFCSEVDHEKYPEVEQKQRFMLIPSIIPAQPAMNPPFTQAPVNVVEEMKKPEAEAPKEEPAKPEAEAPKEEPAKPEAEAPKEEPAKPAAEALKTESAKPAEDKKPETASASSEEREDAEEEEISLDPLVLEFLDADTYRKRLNILAAIQPRITNDMINTMAVAVGVEVEGNDPEERLISLKTCLLTKERYECSRLR